MAEARTKGGKQGTAQRAAASARAQTKTKTPAKRTATSKPSASAATAKRGATATAKRTNGAASKRAATAAKTAAAKTNGAAASNGHVDDELRGVNVETLEALLAALSSARDGDFSVRLPARRRDLMGDISAAYNDLVDRNARMTKELIRIGRVIGREGRMAERASLGFVGGDWESQSDSINGLIDDLSRPTTEVARVIDAVADGDLSQKMALTSRASRSRASSCASARR